MVTHVLMTIVQIIPVIIKLWMMGASVFILPTMMVYAVMVYVRYMVSVVMTGIVLQDRVV